MAWAVITGLIVLALLVYGISVYNHLILLLNRVENAFAQMEVQLKRRYDLIPNLVEVAKRYLSHEEQTLVRVVEARSAAKVALQKVDSSLDGAHLSTLAQAESTLTHALQGLNITIEAYPDLKASQNMLSLTEELSTTENKIAFSRQAYNDSVTNFNIYKQSFPNVLISAMFARLRDDRKTLEFDAQQLESAPKVQF
ncbi:LemA family protein [Helicobacter sp.]|uniref:LemA family protein n=1 Tax=Helicobacter sp. TaxID=218 RepID=UPI0025BB7F70|nr:LemA family protein [Helicobacter sp.]MBR2495029.1 LemA family protein [Helicobacter sp.]